MSRASDERGATIALVAVALFLLAVSAAWAVDTSAFYGTLRADQTVADLACLAGAAELPGNNQDVFDQVAAIVRLNWDALESASVVSAGDTAAMTNGSGDRALFEIGADGDPNSLRVEIIASHETSFGRVAGLSSVELGRVATCSGGDFADRPDTVPFGVPAGGFTGGLFGPNPCGSGSGNCGSIFIDGESNSEFVNGTAHGTDVVVTPNTGGSAGSDCRTVAAGSRCDVVSSNTGVSASIMGDALLARLDDPVHECLSWVRGGNHYNCDTLAQVLGGPPGSLISEFASRPPWWEPSLLGDYNTANTTNHFYWNAPIAHCDSPRLVTIPIVTADLGWKLGDPPVGWPSGKKDMKVVGMLDFVILQPDGDEDFNGSGNLKQVSGAVVWFGPDATCWDGRLPYGTLNGADGVVENLVRLEPNS